MATLRTVLGILSLSALLLLLTACGTQPDVQIPAVEHGTGFVFDVDPARETVTLVETPTLESRHDPSYLPSDTRILRPDEEIALRNYSYAFSRGNRFVIRARFKNVTEGLTFEQPFFFTLNEDSARIKSATAPLVTDRDLGGDGVLSPGERTRKFTFEVKHKGRPFTFLVDTSAVVPGITERVSVSSGGEQGNATSFLTAMSADGRHVVFFSYSSNLVPGSNARLFLRDRGAGRTEAIAWGGWPAISADGRVVAFTSDAADLVPDDTNGVDDAFVYDRQRRRVERVSVSSRGAQADGVSDLFVSLSADGRYVAFQSEATNLVPGDSNGVRDIFVRDRETGVTERVSVSSAGAQGNVGSGVWGVPALSHDGRYVAFASSATNLVPDDSNGHIDVFVRDRDTGTTERVSVGSSGAEAHGFSGGPTLSADGRYVAFDSLAPDLVPGDANGVRDVFVHDRLTGATERVSVDGRGGEVDGESHFSAISADGRVVTFVSAAAELVPDDTNGVADVFVHDRPTGATERVSVDSRGRQGNDRSADPSISADGRTVAFVSIASNLVADDTNASWDIFVHDRQP